MARQEGGQCSIAAMKHPVAWLFGGFALFGFLRRRREAPAGPDPRADELRRKLAESRSIVEERDEFEAAEVTVDLAEPAPPRIPKRDAAPCTTPGVRRSNVCADDT